MILFLDGGFIFLLTFSLLLPGEMIQFDLGDVLQTGWLNHQLVLPFPRHPVRPPEFWCFEMFDR